MGERKWERKRADAEKERERETDLPRLVFWFFVLFWEIYAVVLFKLYIFNQGSLVQEVLFWSPGLNKVAEPCLKEMTALPLHFKTFERSGEQKKSKK